MELKLSLGDPPSTRFSPVKRPAKNVGLRLSFPPQIHDNEADSDERSSAEPSLQLNLLPLPPQPERTGLLFTNQNRNLELDVNKPAEREEGAPSSPNSGMSSFQLEFSGNTGDGMTAAMAGEAERASSRASDEDEFGPGRKKLRLSKDQSAFLEESFKEHNTLNPKQKLTLARQLNLRPRQVEVWFQNRRARTKLKQTEVDCEHLKQCCEKLTDENRRLHKELAELRALKSASPFYMNFPATTLSMCASCERKASSNASGSSAASAGNGRDGRPDSFAALLSKSQNYPFGTKSVPSSSLSPAT